MTVSVIIPVYNVKPYLERCIQSVQQQTYKDLEIILVDDGSTDGSGELCDQIANGDTRITVTHQKNQGLSVARNTGIRQAKGEYIVFMDSDDSWLLNDGLEQLVRIADRKADMVACKLVHFYKGKKVFTADYDIEYVNSLASASEVFAYLIYTQQFSISACPLMVRRQLLIDYDIFFPQGLISEDIFWSIMLWQHLVIVRFTNLNFYGYHHREASLTTTFNIHAYESYDHIFSYWEAQCDAKCKNADAIRSYLANLWVNRGYIYHCLNNNDKPEALCILKKHKNLLNYGSSPKSKRTRKLVKTIGVKATAIVLGWYWQIRGIVKH